MVRSLIQTILALATSGMLVLEGGKSLIDFLLQLSCLKWSPQYNTLCKKHKNAEGIARELQGLCCVGLCQLDHYFNHNRGAG